MGDVEEKMVRKSINTSIGVPSGAKIAWEARRISFYAFLCVTLFAAGCAQVPAPTTALIDPNLPPPTPREFRAAWVATVANIDWPSKKGLPVEAQQEEIIRIVARARELNLNVGNGGDPGGAKFSRGGRREIRVDQCCRGRGDLCAASGEQRCTEESVERDSARLPGNFCPESRANASVYTFTNHFFFHITHATKNITRLCQLRR